MNEQLYKKKGRRYIPVGYTDGFTGFPTEGIWAVYKNEYAETQECIAKVGEFKNIDYSIIATLIKENKDKIIDRVDKNLKTGWSVNKIIDVVFTTLLEKNETCK